MSLIKGYAAISVAVSATSEIVKTCLEWSQAELAWIVREELEALRTVVEVLFGWIQIDFGNYVGSIICYSPRIPHINPDRLSSNPVRAQPVPRSLPLTPHEDERRQALDGSLVGW